MDVGDGEVCPACGTPADGDPWCSSCGLELTGSEAQQFRSLAGQLAAAEESSTEPGAGVITWPRNCRISSGRGRSTSRRPRPPRPHRRGHRPRRREGRVERRAGTQLLALDRSDTARAVGAGVHGGRVDASRSGRPRRVAGRDHDCLRVRCHRIGERLPATSGALTGLTIALALIDWQIVRRAGVAPGVSGTAWWSIGTAVVSAAAVALGRVASPVPARRAVAVLAPVSALLAVAASSTSAWNAALGLSAVAALLVAVERVLDGRVADPVVHALIRIEAGASWIVGAAFVVVAAVEPTVSSRRSRRPRSW